MFGGAPFADTPFAGAPGVVALVVAPLYAPELVLGPPMRGAPWVRRLPHDERARLLVRQAPSTLAYAPELHAGPPLRGAPWLGRLPWAEGGLLRGTMIQPGNRGGAPVARRPRVARVPPGSDERRPARFTERVSAIVNSLIAQGLLVQTGTASWAVTPLMPSLTQAQRDALVAPPKGGIIYNTTTGRPNYWDGTAWVVL